MFCKDCLIKDRLYFKTGFNVEVSTSNEILLIKRGAASYEK